MPRCAFLTLADPTGFHLYDHLAVGPLETLGWQVETIPWTREDVAWQNFDAVVIRSTWDYQNNPEHFLHTLESIERSGPRVLNPIATCRWNLDKRYLRDLEQRGVPIVPTRWPESLDPSDLAAAAEHFGTETLIAKPPIGANADDTFILPRDASPNSHPEAFTRFADRPLLLQPFLPSIRTQGEVSLFYFGGDYSHAVLKTPKSGDFRVQEEHGGRIESHEPGADLLEVGQRTIAALGERLLYARVDLVFLPGGSPTVIEVELIEPSLYFPYDEASPHRFATALDRMMSESSP